MRVESMGRVVLVSLGALAALVVLSGGTAAAQTSKPGLWETSTTMQMAGMAQPQLPPDVLAKMKANGVTIPGMAGNVLKGKACVTQEMIDKFGGTELRKGCDVNIVSRTSSSMKVELTCTGSFNGKGTVDITRVDADHATAKTHLTGTSGNGANGAHGTHPMDMTIESTSTFLSASCGDVQPGHPVME